MRYYAYCPKLNAILYEALKENGVMPNQTSYIGGIISHMKLLKKLGKKRKTIESLTLKLLRAGTQARADQQNAIEWILFYKVALQKFS